MKGQEGQERKILPLQSALRTGNGDDLEVTGTEKAIGQEKASMGVVNGPFDPAWRLGTFPADIYVRRS